MASLGLFGCHPDKAEALVLNTESGRISLSFVLPGEWEKVCILTPYSTKEQATALLGFEYDVSGRSGIGIQDGITLLVTIDKSHVMGEYEVPRGNADFTALGSRCFLRENSDFSIQQTNDGWNELRNN